MEETKRFKVFRNNSDVRVIRLRSRDPEKPREDYDLLPGKTVEALDTQEELLLASMSYLTDVEKETPEMGTKLSDLQKQLADEREKNNALREENSRLQDESVKVKRVASARR